MTTAIRSGQVTNDITDAPIPGASIYVYNADGTQASLTSDGTTALSQPLTTDQFGNYSYYAVVGYYREDTWYAGKLRFRENNIALGSPGADLALRSDLAASGGSALVSYLSSATGATARTATSKLGDLDSTADFPNHATADAAGRPLLVPAAGITSTRANGAAVLSNHRGPGQVTTADGNKRGKWFANVTARPSSLGTHTSADTAFNGDLAHSIFQVEHRLSGLALSQPTSGYVHTPEACPFYGVLYNASGWNNGTADNVGRTGVEFFRVNIQQYGQGDAVAYNATAFVTGTRAGSTNYLANPAAALFNGDMTAGHDGVYLNARELVLHDGSFDVAAGGDVVNLDRNNATGANGAWWWGYRVHSQGSQPVNNMLNGVGKFNAGLDLALTGLDFGTNKAAISLKADDRVYFNNSDGGNGTFSTAFNGWYAGYSTAATAIVFTANGSGVFQIAASQITFVKPPVLPVIVAASLPAAVTANKGMEYYVSDLTATTRASVAAGGGANFGKVYSTGSQWLIA